MTIKTLVTITNLETGQKTLAAMIETLGSDGHVTVEFEPLEVGSE